MDVGASGHLQLPGSYCENARGEVLIQFGRLLLDLLTLPLTLGARPQRNLPCFHALVHGCRKCLCDC
jgi:hypothetical protein